MATSKTAVLDSSALVALVREDDADYSRAAKLDDFIIKYNWDVLLPYEVLAETLNLLGKKFGRQVAAAAGQAILERVATEELTLIPSDTVIIRKTCELQLLASGGPSFIDCLVMAQADTMHTPFIFGFDAAFRKNGYHLPDKNK